MAVDPRWRPLAPSAATRSRIDCAAEHLVQARCKPSDAFPLDLRPALRSLARPYIACEHFCSPAPFCSSLADLRCSAHMVEAATSADDASAMAGIWPRTCSIGSRARRQRIHTGNACRAFDGGGDSPVSPCYHRSSCPLGLRSGMPCRTTVDMASVQASKASAGGFRSAVSMLPLMSCVRIR